MKSKFAIVALASTFFVSISLVGQTTADTSVASDDPRDQKIEELEKKVQELDQRLQKQEQKRDVFGASTQQDQTTAPNAPVVNADGPFSIRTNDGNFLFRFGADLQVDN